MGRLHRNMLMRAAVLGDQALIRSADRGWPHTVAITSIEFLGKPSPPVTPNTEATVSGYASGDAGRRKLMLSSPTLECKHSQDQFLSIHFMPSTVTSGSVMANSMTLLTLAELSQQR